MTQLDAQLDPHEARAATAPADLPWGRTWPSLGEFREMATDRRVVPVVRPLLADDATPVGLYRTLAQSRPGSFILESAESDGVWATARTPEKARPAAAQARGTNFTKGSPYSSGSGSVSPSEPEESDDSVSPAASSSPPEGLSNVESSG